MQRLIGFVGLLVLLALAFLFSTARRAIKPRTVVLGLTLQFALALIVLRWDWGIRAMNAAGNGVRWLLGFSVAGSEFLFGPLGGSSGLSFLSSSGQRFDEVRIFAFLILPTIIFISALFAILYYLGIMQFVIRQVAKVMRLMGASGAESMDVAASIFMGQTEAPLSIRPYLPEMTRSELMTVMTAGMAHVSGSIMAAYIAFGVKPEHLLTAVIMTAPGTILMAKMLVPETEHPLTAKFDTPGAAMASAQKADVVLEDEHQDANILAAIARGTTDGLRLAVNVGAMLIAFVALIALADGIFAGVHNHIAHWFPSSLEETFGYVFAPIAWIIGVPWHDAHTVGNLLGLRMSVNELIAFKALGPMKPNLDPRTFTIATFALCGFANLSSIGIQIGGIGALAPNKRNELAKLGFRAMFAGTMANLMSAAIVGILYRG
jgi:CNT family concentrative nucleoside transporter